MRPAMAIIMTAVSLSTALASWTSCSAQDRRALQDHIKRALHSTDELRYRAAEADLNGDGVKEITVYITSPESCGSGGCNTLVLQRRGRSYRTVMNATITWPPIRALKTRTHGWQDIGVMVGGGGIIPSREAVMRFNGKRYPSNPSAAPTAGRDVGGQL